MNSTTTPSSSSLDDNNEEKIHIRVKTLNNNTFEFDGVDVNATVLEFQKLVKEKTGIEESRQRIIYRGKMLKSTEKISAYKIQDGHTLHLCARPLEATPSDRSYEERESTARNQRRELFSSLLAAGQNGVSTNGVSRPLVVSSQLAAQLGRNALVGSTNQSEGDGLSARGALARPSNARIEHVWQGLLTLNTLMSTMDIASSTEIIPDWRDAPSVPPLIDDEEEEMKGTEEDEEKKTTEADWKRKFFVGQWLDVKDTINQWLEATILRISDTRLYVTYNGWPSRWDEWIEHTSDRIAPFRTKTLHASTSPHMSPSPVSWIASAPSTGPNDVRSLISSVKNMIKRTMPMIEQFDQMCVDSSEEKHQEEEEVSSKEDGESDEKKEEEDGEGDEKKEEEEEDLDSWSNNERIQAYATELAPVLDRLGRIVSDLAPHIAMLNRRHRRHAGLVSTPTSTTTSTEDENATTSSSSVTADVVENTTTTTTTDTSAEAVQHENTANTFTQLISTASNSPHLARRQGNVDIHIHAILTPFGQNNNGNGGTSSSNTNNDNTQADDSVGSSSTDVGSDGTTQNNASRMLRRRHEERMQSQFRSSRNTFGPIFRSTVARGGGGGDVATNQQRQRLGQSIVSMIRQYQNNGSGQNRSEISGIVPISAPTTTTTTTTTTTNTTTTISNSADALSAATDNSGSNNGGNDNGDNGGGNNERPSACSQQID
jgi:hypothetical protein